MDAHTCMETILEAFEKKFMETILEAFLQSKPVILRLMLIDQIEMVSNPPTFLLDSMRTETKNKCFCLF